MGAKVRCFIRTSATDGTVVGLQHCIDERHHTMSDVSPRHFPHPAQPAAAHSGEQGLILVIEDDVAIQEMLSEILTDAGYQVVSTDLGGEGLMLIETAVPQLVTLDLMLPDVHGEQVLEAIRHYRARSTLPVVVISAASTIPPAVHTLSDAVLPKPFDLDLLLSTIDTLVPKAAPSSGRECSVGGRNGTKTCRTP
jgi:DNA-binding response OmpR family regulator